MVEFLLRRGFDLEAKDNVRFLLNCIAYFIIYIILVTGLLVHFTRYKSLEVSYASVATNVT
jgi:hypothetical protein